MGSQYDAMLNWVKNGNGTDKDKIIEQGIGNNSSKVVTATGNATYSNDSINNIRDLEGNLFEWTLEAYNTTSRVGRGGNCGSSHSPIYRGSDYSSNPGGRAGSRLTLYIK